MVKEKNFVLIDARQRAGLSQTELATKIGITRFWMSAIENGKGEPSLDIAKKIAKVLEKPIEELFPD